MPILAEIPVSNSNNKTEKINNTYRWWLTDDKEAHLLPTRIFSVADTIRKNNSARSRQNFRYAMMYNDWDNNPFATQIGGSHFMNRGSGESYQHNRMRLNMVQNGIDTAASIVAKDKPQPQFLTDGAKDYQQKIKAKKLTKYINGVFKDAGIYSIADQVFTDACVYGTGAIKLITDTDQGKIKAEWVFIEELLVDELDGFRGTPRQMHQRKLVSRDELLFKYAQNDKDLADKIMTASSDLKGEVVSRTVTDTLITVESWHLPTTKDSDDGRHTIVINNATLLDEVYTKDYFPIQVFRWYPSSISFYGRGICQEVGKIQVCIDKLVRMMDQGIELMVAPVWMVENSANVDIDALLSNDIGRFISYSNIKPEAYTPEAIPNLIPQWIDSLWNYGFKIIGVNQQMASGQNELGPNASGTAIREMTDISHGRFQIVNANWEEYFMNLARVIVDMSRDLYKTNKSLSITLKDNKFISSINWKDVDPKGNPWDVDVYPVSMLPKTPGARMQTVMDWYNLGWITQEQAMSLLDFPDLQDTASLETSTIEYVAEAMSQIKETGTYLAPIPQLNLQMALKLATLEVVRSKTQAIPDDHIALIEQFIDEINFFLSQAQPPPQQPQGQQQAQPNPQPLQQPQQ